MSRFYAPASLTEQRVHALLIGLGATGGDVFDAVVRLHLALLMTGHPGGLHVTAMDGDTVSAANTGRQRFCRSDIGHNKAIVLTHRYALCHDLDWEAVPEYCTLDADGEANVSLRGVDLLISCVDRAAVRVGLAKAARAQGASGLWADFGNSARTGQFILGHLGVPESPLERLPHIVDLYPELATHDDAQEPSCSFEQAISRQDLFINPVLAYTGVSMLWNLFRYGSLSEHGAFVDVSRTSVQPLPIEPQAWSIFGYHRPTPRVMRARVP